MFGIKRSWRLSSWKWRSASLVIIGGVIPFGIAMPRCAHHASQTLHASWGDCASAQITPDRTLGTEGSRLTPNVQINGAVADRIEGGAQRGGNLFHSFSQFNVGDGQRVYFANPSGIQNILTRVTGQEASNILGTLGVEGSANLFLLNPNGILFGPNAQLDVGGSFVGTTANAIRFGEQGVFSATNPQAPPLLTVNPSALFFNQLNPGAIANQSTAPSGVNPNGENTTGLRVPDGKSLLLVGGNVNLDGGGIRAYGGRIELTGLAAPGSIGLNVAGDTLNLSIPNDVPRADVSLTNLARASVFGAGGGDIVIKARNLEISSSSLFAGIGIGLGNAGTQAGDITLNATGAITIADGAQLDASTLGQGDAGSIFLQASDQVSLSGGTAIFTDVDKDARGQGGDIHISTGSLSLTNGAQLLTSTSGAGDAGDVSINARGINFQGSFSDSDGNIFASQVRTGAEAGAVGKAGDVRITTETLSISDGAAIIASTRGQGDAGDIFIDASDRVSLKNTIGSGISSSVEQNGVGQGGTIQIRTEALSLADLSFITSDTDGKGDAGSIFIDAGSLFMTRSDPTLFGSGSISTSTNRQGDAGNITINVRDTISIDKGLIESGVLDTGSDDAGFAGEGKGGDIRIATGALRLMNGALLSASSTGQGDAGNIFVNARDTISVNNGSDISTNISSFNGSTAKGRAGDIQINARSLFITDGVVNSGTDGQGNSGKIDIRVTDQVVLDGGSNNSFTAVASEVNTDGVGRSGEIQITTGSLSLANNAVLLSATGGQGNAGNVIINGRDRVSFSSGGQLLAGTLGQGNAGNVTIRTGDLSIDGVNPVNNQRSGIFATVEQKGVGRAGNVDITADSLALTNGGIITAFTSEQGRASDITINARSLLLDRGFIAAETASTNGGNITLQLDDALVLRNNSLISTNAGTATAGGNGGNIAIDAPFIVAVPSENSDITANAFTGNGGNIDIASRGIFGTQFREDSTPQSDITASSEFGFQGSVEINTPDVDPSQGLVELPVELVDASNQIAPSCATVAENKFTITGRGGLPPNPIEPLSGSMVLTNLATLPQRAEGAEGAEEEAAEEASKSPPASPPLIVEAQGWVINNKGEVVLTATPPTLTPHIPWMTTATCHVPPRAS